MPIHSHSAPYFRLQIFSLNIGEENLFWSLYIGPRAIIISS